MTKPNKPIFIIKVQTIQAFLVTGHLRTIHLFRPHDNLDVSQLKIAVHTMVTRRATNVIAKLDFFPPQVGEEDIILSKLGACPNAPCYFCCTKRSNTR